MTTIRAQHHGARVVNVSPAVPTTDAFRTRGRYYTEEVSVAEVARRFGTSDAPRANRTTAADMNAAARAFYKR